MNNLFSFYYEIAWFDSHIDAVDYQWYTEIFDDGSINYHEYCYDSGISVTKKWQLNSTKFDQIKKIISKITIACCSFQNSEEIEYLNNNNYEIIGENKYEVYDYWAFDKNTKKLDNHITEKYIVGDVFGNKEITFSYKPKYISSEMFCMKAPFTLLAKEAANIIQEQYPEFHAII